MTGSVEIADYYCNPAVVNMIKKRIETSEEAVKKSGIYAAVEDNG